MHHVVVVQCIKCYCSYQTSTHRFGAGDTWDSRHSWLHRLAWKTKNIQRAAFLPSDRNATVSEITTLTTLSRKASQNTRPNIEADGLQQEKTTSGSRFQCHQPKTGSYSRQSLMSELSRFSDWATGTLLKHAVILFIYDVYACADVPHAVWMK